MKSLVLKEVKRDAKLKITKFYKNINTSPTKRTKHNKKAAVPISVMFSPNEL